MSIVKGSTIKEIVQDLNLNRETIRKTSDTKAAIEYGETAPSRYKDLYEKQKTLEYGESAAGKYMKNC